MAIQRTHSKKAPSQNPVDFYKGRQHGGAHGGTQRVGDRLTGGPMREPINGKRDLAKQ